MKLSTAAQRAALALALALAAAVQAQIASPHAIDTPKWFTDSLLDFDDEAAAAARSGRRLMVYFGQDGCPYCKELMQTNFSQQEIVDKARRHFVAIAINIWGDREVTWVDGRRTTEKMLARMLKVQYTPTVLFLDADGTVVARLNGYYPPNRFSAALDYVSGRLERSQPLGDYLQHAAKDAASASLNEQAFFLKPPHDLRRQRRRQAAGGDLRDAPLPALRRDASRGVRAARSSGATARRSMSRASRCPIAAS